MFTKKVLKLPPNTPNYVLTVECGLQDMFIHTLGRHLNYIYKVLFLYDLDRLAHKLAVMGIDNSNDWWLEWDNYGKQFNLDWNNRDSHIWKNNIQTILSRVKEGIFNDSLSSARNCSTVFNSLSYLNGNGFFKLNLRVEVVSLLLKIRSTLIPLNDKPWRSVERRICSLCNRNEIENVEHFIGTCPILSEFRILYFGVSDFNKHNSTNNGNLALKVIEILKGPDWINLYNFVKKALSYRNELINYFNF